MTGYEWFQGLIVGLIVAACVLQVARKMFSRSVNDAQMKLSMTLSRSSRPAIIRRIGASLAPDLASGAGCGNGCNSCASCESNPQKQEEKPLAFHRHI